jgi:CheY-like chemotaxis protein
MTSPNPRVLYCDDDSDTREMMRLWLECQRFDVVVPNDPLDCLNFTADDKVDVYVLDNRMETMCGVELCKQLKSAHPQTPVIFYSGAAAPKDVDEGLAAGAHAYVTKPNFDKILEAIRTALSVSADIAPQGQGKVITRKRRGTQRERRQSMRVQR